jgi:hypothetical protein
VAGGLGRSVLHRHRGKNRERQLADHVAKASTVGAFAATDCTTLFEAQRGMKGRVFLVSRNQFELAPQELERGP